MVGRFTARRSSAPESPPVASPPLVPSAEPVPDTDAEVPPTPSFMTMPEPAKAPAEPGNPLHSDKYLDAKVQRWIGTISGLPGGNPAPELRERHQPDGKLLPNL